ncbi:MAG: hypothetical protein JWQ30_1859 [Sediminibacterium sp.]|nr:hypothetical protein [Sediminibacterium sp.]
MHSLISSTLLQMIDDFTFAKQYIAVNSCGPVDPGAPFSLFGPAPAPGSFFAIGTSEWQANTPGEIFLSLSWRKEGLPGNFTDHYSGYGASFNNHSFLVSFSILLKGKWQTLSIPSNPLFATDAYGKISAYSVFHLIIDKRFLKMGQTENPDALRFGQSKTGFIKMELTAPAYGFGSGLYANAVATALLNSKGGIPGVMPGVPYIPVIDTLGLRYVPG